MNRIIKIGLFLIILFWCAGFFSEFLFPLSEKLIYLIPFLKTGYSFVCHQEGAKLITSGIYSSLVCSRCAGIYLGALAASGGILFIPRNVNVLNRYLFLSAFPMVFDVICTSLKIYNYTKTGAFFTGFLFGVVSFLYFYNALLDLITELRDKTK